MIRDSFRVHGYAAIKMKKHTTPDRNGPVQHVKPHPIVWKRALALAEGDKSRIQVIDESTVVVLNHPAHQKLRLKGE